MKKKEINYDLILVILVAIVGLVGIFNVVEIKFTVDNSQESLIGQAFFSSEDELLRNNAKKFFIAPDGNDNNPGTLERPFKTIEKAKDFVRTINKDMKRDIIVYLRQGIYSLDSTLEFDSRDSGTNGFNIIYRSFPREDVIISGDFSANPMNTPELLENALIGNLVHPKHIEGAISVAYQENQIDIPGVTPDDFVKAIQLSVKDLF